MILVDTSVWIDYFNGVDNFHTTALDLGLIEGTAAIGDIIFLEILQGFRKNSDYKNTKTRLSRLKHYEMFGHRMVNNYAENYRSLRRKGITIRSTTDVTIATFCIENNFLLALAETFNLFSTQRFC